MIRRPTRRRECGGQVLILTLVGSALLAGLVFYAYNLGDQVNRRGEMQHAADAAVISGAGWMARSMNMVAMNNVGAVKLLSLVPVLDAMPLATRMSWEEARDWEEMLAEQLDRDMPDDRGGGPIVTEALAVLRERMATQRDVLRPFDRLLNEGGYDVREQTYWRLGGGGPDGRLWSAALALTDASEATVVSAGELAQANAVRFGERSGAEVVFLAPVLPRMPARRGTFEDFRPPLLGSVKVRSTYAAADDDGPGGGIGDMAYPHRLGPYARLHRWRYWDRVPTAWEYVPPTPGHGETRGGNRNVNVGGRRRGDSGRTQRGGHSGRYRATEWRTIGYHTFGPYRWAMHRLGNWALDHEVWADDDRREVREGVLPDVRWYEYVRELSSTKLEYMFRDVEPGQRYHYPEWGWSYPPSLAVARRDEDLIYQTLFFLVEIVSKYPQTDGRWLSPGTYRTNGDRPMVIWSRGWTDPMEWGVPKVADYVWRDDWGYQTREDREIGIQRRYDDEGNPIWQDVYVTSYWVFGGVDLGEDVEVRNPCNYEDDDGLPYPILIDTSEGDYQDSPVSPWRREYFSYLGVARERAEPAFWADRFHTSNPGGWRVALAEAEVFNASSWGLWTQDWQVRLRPVTGMEDWSWRIEQGAPDAVDEFVTPEQINEILPYVSAMDDETAEALIHH
jgi:hypothetical protein